MVWVLHVVKETGIIDSDLSDLYMIFSGWSNRNQLFSWQALPTGFGFLCRSFAANCTQPEPHSSPRCSRLPRWNMIPVPVRVAKTQTFQWYQHHRTWSKTMLNQTCSFEAVWSPETPDRIRNSIWNNRLKQLCLLRIAVDDYVTPKWKQIKFWRGTLGEMCIEINRNHILGMPLTLVCTSSPMSSLTLVTQILLKVLGK